jgi:hypothetical protein
LEISDQLVTTLDDAQGSFHHSPARNTPYLKTTGTIAAIIGFLAVVLVYSLATAALLWPLLEHLSSALIGPPEDNLNDFWDTWYLLIGHDAHIFRTTLLRFPEGTSLIYQSFAWPQLGVVYLLSRTFGTGIPTLTALQNLTVLASFPLAGTGAFYLVRHFVRSNAGALIGGFIYAFNPSHVAHALHHAGVSSIEFLPFFVLAYLLALERRSNMWLGFAAICYALSALSCWYYLFYGAYFILFWLIYQTIRDRAWPHGWALTASLRCLLWTIVLLLPLLVPMILTARGSVYDSGGNTFVADLLGYVTFPPEHLLSGLASGINHRFAGYPWEATVYLGLINLAVLIWVCIRTGLARTSVAFLVVFGMSFFAVLASGEALHIAGIATYFYLPDAILDRLPFLANVRAPSRIIVFSYLFLAVGVGAAAATALGASGWMRRMAVALAAVLIVLDFYPAHLTTTAPTCARGLALLTADPERGFGVFNLPISYADEDSYMLDQICDHRALVDGMISRETGTTLIDQLSLNDLARQKAQLRNGHVKYIVIHRPRNGLYSWNSWLPPVARFLQTYHEVYSGPDIVLLRVY